MSHYYILERKVKNKEPQGTSKMLKAQIRTNPDKKGDQYSVVMSPSRASSSWRIFSSAGKLLGSAQLGKFQLELITSDQQPRFLEAPLIRQA